VSRLTDRYTGGFRVDKIKTGLELAQQGQIADAVATFEQAFALDSQLRFDSKTEAKRVLVQVLVKEGKELARKGNIEEAIAKFEEALALDASLDIDPENEAKRFAAEGLKAQG
jgi:tetratricopeptide (TPR) repeat protein